MIDFIIKKKQHIIHIILSCVQKTKTLKHRHLPPPIRSSTVELTLHVVTTTDHRHRSSTNHENLDFQTETLADKCDQINASH